MIENPAYLLPPLTALVFSIVLTGIVLKQSKQYNLSTWLFAGFLLSIALWSFLLFGMRSSATIEQALLWEKGTPIAFYIVFVLFYHFSLEYTGIKKQRLLLYSAYIFLLVIIALSPTNLLIESMRLEPYGYAPNSGYVGYTIGLIGIFLLFAGGYNLFRTYRTTIGYERNRYLYLAMATCLPFIGSLLDGFTNLPPTVIWCNTAFSVICAILVLKYRLLDIRTIARHTLSYILVSFLIAIPYVTVLLLLARHFGDIQQSWWLHGTIIVLLAIVLRPLQTWAQNYIDRTFFQARYNYMKELVQFSQETQSVTDLPQLVSRFLTLTKGTVYATSTSLLLSNDSGSTEFTVISDKEGTDTYTISLSESVLQWLSIHNESLSVNDINKRASQFSLNPQEEIMFSSMQEYLLVPMKCRENKLTGILLVGARKKGHYSDDEKQLLTTLSNQMALSIENARLYTDAVKSRHDLEAWLNAMNDGVLIHSEQGTIHFANRAIGSLFDLHTGDTINKELTRICKEESPITTDGTDIPGNSHYIEIENRSYEVVSAPLLGPDSTTSIISVFRDISERIRLETERRSIEQKAQLASRLATVGEMASGIAHEINNPLTGVIGYAQILMRRDIAPEIREEVDIIYQAAKRVEEIVKRLLTFARQRKPERKMVQINDILETSLGLRKYNLSTESIATHLNLAPDLPEIAADPGQLQQVFLNIIINAEKAVKSQATDRQINISTFAGEETIKIGIADNGPGMTPEVMEQMFTPFFTTRDPGQGTGLGLSLCHGIIADHNGRIYAESKPGNGATFIIELPVSTVAITQEPVKVISHKPEETGNCSVLIVDDEQIVRQVMSEMLINAGYRVISAEDSITASGLLSKHSFDIIFLDIKLPGISGIEYYRHIADENPELARKIIFMTGDVMSNDTNQFLTKSNIPFITKPFTIEQIEKVMKKVK